MKKSLAILFALIVLPASSPAPITNVAGIASNYLATGVSASSNNLTVVSGLRTTIINSATITIGGNPVLTNAAGAGGVTNIWQLAGVNKSTGDTLNVVVQTGIIGALSNVTGTPTLYLSNSAAASGGGTTNLETILATGPSAGNAGNQPITNLSKIGFTAGMSLTNISSLGLVAYGTDQKFIVGQSILLVTNATYIYNSMSASGYAIYNQGQLFLEFGNVGGAPGINGNASAPTVLRFSNHGSIDFSLIPLENVGTPTTGLQPANKGYVDTVNNTNTLSRVLALGNISDTNRIIIGNSANVTSLTGPRLSFWSNLDVGKAEVAFWAAYNDEYERVEMYFHNPMIAPTNSLVMTDVNLYNHLNDKCVLCATESEMSTNSRKLGSLTVAGWSNYVERSTLTNSIVYTTNLTVDATSQRNSLVGNTNMVLTLNPPLLTNSPTEGSLATNINPVNIGIGILTQEMFWVFNGFPSNNLNSLFSQPATNSLLGRFARFYTGTNSTYRFGEAGTNQIAGTKTGYYLISVGSVSNSTNKPTWISTNGFTSGVSSNWLHVTNGWAGGVPLGSNITITATLSNPLPTFALQGNLTVSNMTVSNLTVNTATITTLAGVSVLTNGAAASLTLTNGTTATNLFVYQPLIVTNTVGKSKIVLGGLDIRGLAYTNAIQIFSTEPEAFEVWNIRTNTTNQRLDVFNQGWDGVDTVNPSFIFLSSYLTTNNGGEFASAQQFDIGSIYTKDPYFGAVFFGGHETPFGSFTFSPVYSNYWPTTIIRQVFHTNVTGVGSSDSSPALALGGSGSYGKHSSFNMGFASPTGTTFRIVSDPRLLGANDVRFETYTIEGNSPNYPFRWAPWMTSPSDATAGSGMQTLHYTGATNTTFWWDNNSASLVSIGTTNRNATLAVGGSIHVAKVMFTNGTEIIRGGISVNYTGILVAGVSSTFYYTNGILMGTSAP